MQQIKGPSLAPTFTLTMVALALVLIMSLIVAVLPMGEAAQTTVAGILGWFTKLAGDAWNYFFGTTRGSDQKTALLAAAGPLPAAPAPTYPSRPLLPPEPDRDPVAADQLHGTPFQ